MEEYKFICLKEVLKITGLKKSHLYQLIKKGAFPKQVEVGERKRLWSLREIWVWMDERLGARGSLSR